MAWVAPHPGPLPARGERESCGAAPVWPPIAWRVVATASPLPACGERDRVRGDRGGSLAEALQDGGDVDLVGLVVAGQDVHHEVDAEAGRDLALRLAARDAREGRAALLVERPGAGPVVAADDDAGDPVIDPVLDRLDPHLAAGPAAGELVQEIE